VAKPFRGPDFWFIRTRVKIILPGGGCLPARHSFVGLFEAI